MEPITEMYSAYITANSNLKKKDAKSKNKIQII